MAIIVEPMRGRDGRAGSLSNDRYGVDVSCLGVGCQAHKPAADNPRLRGVRHSFLFFVSLVPPADTLDTIDSL